MLTTRGPRPKVTETSHLAYAFYLAKCGQEQEAGQLMSEWLTRNFSVFRSETLERISKLFKEAVDSPHVLAFGLRYAS